MSLCSDLESSSSSFMETLIVTLSTVTTLCLREWELIRHSVYSGWSFQATCPWLMRICPSVSWSYAMTADTMESLCSPMPSRVPPRLAVVPSTMLRMNHPIPPTTSIFFPGSMIILGATCEFITLFCPRLDRPRLRFVPWSLLLDPCSPPFFLRVSDHTFEVFCCDASSDLEEVDSSL